MNAHSKTGFSRRPTDRPVAADVRAGLLKDPGFGKVFTDHMVTTRASLLVLAAQLQALQRLIGTLEKRIMAQHRASQESKRTG